MFPLLNLPNELLSAVAAHLPNLKRLNDLSRTNRRLYSLLNPELYKCDARDKEKSRALPWAVKHGRFDILRRATAAGASYRGRDGRTALHVAAMHNQTAMAEALLDVPGIGVDDKDSNDLTALHIAAECGDVGVSRVLLVKGADPKLRCVRDMSPLDYATEKGCIELVELLLHHGVDVNEGDAQQPALFCAIKAGQHEVVKLLLEHGASMEFPCTDPGCTTALIQAADQGHADVIATLISHGADPLRSDNNGDTPLFRAMAAPHVKAVRMLLNKGAEPELTTFDAVLVLRYAIGDRKENVELVQLLLDHGVVASTRDKFGTALHSAVSSGCQSIAELLLRNKVDVNAVNSGGMTALHLAAVAGSRGSGDESAVMVRLLLSNGADIKALDNRGRTPLHLAAERSRDLESLELLLKESNAVANGNALAVRDHGGCTALHHSARNSDLEVMKFLLSRGADPAARDNYGEVALHKAARSHRIFMAKALVENSSIDINSMDNMGRTPLFLAASHGNLWVVRLLVSKQARTDMEDIYGCSILLAAVRNGCVDIVNYLLHKDLFDIPGSLRAVDCFGRTPMWWARSMEDNILMTTIQQCGASIDVEKDPNPEKLRWSVTESAPKWEYSDPKCRVCTRRTVHNDSSVSQCLECRSLGYGSVCLDCQCAGWKKLPCDGAHSEHL